jgi:hypothetical protein
MLRNNINSLCEKLIEEQGKYINYYKVKKSFGTEKQKDFEEMVLKKIGDFNSFEKMDFGLTVHKLNEEIKGLRSKLDEDLILNKDKIK